MAQANIIIRSKEIRNQGFVVFVPRFKVLRKGVIRGVLEDISNEKILENLTEENLNILINKIFRLKKNDYNMH